MSNSNLSYRKDVDGLRAIAVLAVVGYHAFPAWIKGGFVGVDVFFVISGFLITSIITTGIDKGSFSLLGFYAKRINRLYPSLLFVIATSLAVGWMALLPLEFAQLGKHIAGGAAFIANIVLWNEVSYFDNAADTKPFLHLWSLGVEEQFYIIWPLTLLLIAKYRQSLWMWTAAGLVVSFAIGLLLLGKDHASAFYMPHARFWEILAGALLAAALTPTGPTASVILSGSVLGSLTRSTLSAAGVALIATGIMTITKDAAFPGWLALAPVLGTALVIFAGPDAWINRRILSLRVLVWFGLISYPLYLWHWPILSFLRIVEDGNPSRELRMTAVLLSIALAWMTYQFVENPLRTARLKGKTALLFTAMAGIGIAGFTLWKSGGLPQRLKEQNTVSQAFEIPFPFFETFPCANNVLGVTGNEFNNNCFTTKNEPPTVAFIGDSHANHFSNALNKSFPNDSVLMVSHTSCLPFSTHSFFIVKSCETAYKGAIRILEENRSIKTIYLSGYWGYLMSGGFSRDGINWRIPAYLDSFKTSRFHENASALIKAAEKRGITTVLMKDIPYLDFDVRTCFDYRPFRLSDPDHIRSECSMDHVAFVERNRIYDQELDTLLETYPFLQMYNPERALCRDGKCFASDHGLPLYMNGDHVNHYGADLIIEDMVESLRQGR